MPRSHRDKRTLRFVLGDQLSRNLASLSDLSKDDLVLLAEVADETTYVPHHKQKIALVLSAMRHFAEELHREGIDVRYISLDDEKNTNSLTGELKRTINAVAIERIVVTAPGEYRVWTMMREWERELGIPVEIRRDSRFICSVAQFRHWARGRRNLRMEYFYRDMRRQTGLLMEEGKPAGGAWNYDASNRKPWPKNRKAPVHCRIVPDRLTQDVLRLVESFFPDNFGNLDNFGWATTRTEALKVMENFMTQALPHFGDYQDAMKTGEPFLNHSLLSAYLNIGLLSPLEVCHRAETAWKTGEASLENVEGFIRQIIGWREYIRGIYWIKMPGYAQSNALEAGNPLPWMYWSGKTKMVCMAQSIGQIHDHAYGHHIQRLMITGNFALLAGITPAEIEAWYLAVYIDAFEWVELPNVHGMVLFADGGLMSSKPYAASGAYVSRMSDYCQTCPFDPKLRHGEKACPFTVLYWDFLLRNEAKLQHNVRMGLALRNLERLDETERQTIRAAARRVVKLHAAPRIDQSTKRLSQT